MENLNFLLLVKAVILATIVFALSKVNWHNFWCYLNGSCKYCGGEVFHRWHTSSREIDQCYDCGKDQ